jgi:hypothetical protein
MRNIPLQTRNLIKDVAKELGESYELVEEIYFHQFEFLRDCLEVGQKGKYETYHNVLLKHLGTFYASERKINKITEILNGNNREVEQ